MGSHSMTPTAVTEKLKRAQVQVQDKSALDVLKTVAAEK